MHSEASWTQAAQQFQHMMGDMLSTAMRSPFGATPTAGASLPALTFSPDKLKELQQQYLSEATKLWNDSAKESLQRDRRFAGEAWAGNPAAALSAATYLLNARTLMGMAEAVEGDEKTRARVRFTVEQWMAATAPSNFLAFNAEAQALAVKTKGESIAKGLKNLLHDMSQGHVSMTDESVFEVGRNVGTTEGSVVFEN